MERRGASWSVVFQTRTDNTAAWALMFHIASLQVSLAFKAGRIDHDRMPSTHRSQLEEVKVRLVEEEVVEATSQRPLLS